MVFKKKKLEFIRVKIGLLKEDLQEIASSLIEMGRSRSEFHFDAFIYHYDKSDGLFRLISLRVDSCKNVTFMQNLK